MFLYFVEDILTVFLKTVSRKSSMKKTCKETKIFLRSWLGVWLVEEETFISYMVMRLMLKCSNAWQLLFLQAMSGCTKVLEESLEVKNTEI